MASIKRGIAMMTPGLIRAIEHRKIIESARDRSCELSLHDVNSRAIQ
ncbi:MAG: hypothetical protein ACYDGN_12605 [Acidimicrobiales bacterium]